MKTSDDSVTLVFMLDHKQEPVEETVFITFGKTKAECEKKTKALLDDDEVHGLTGDDMDVIEYATVNSK